MKTKQDVLQVLQDCADQFEELVIAWPWGDSWLDHRALPRLVSCLTYAEASTVFGPEWILSEEKWGEVEEWTKETIMTNMLNDLEFSFEKALGQRSISAGMMHNVMRMWMWILDDEDLLNECHSRYNDYGLSYLNLIKERYAVKA